MQFSIENYSDVLTDIKPLLEHHWFEVAAHKEIYDLNPDWELYERMAKQNVLRIFTCRINNQIVGYSIYMVSRHHHYKQSIVARNDITFLIESERKGNIGYKLLKFAIENLTKEADRIIFNVKVYKDFGNILERLGFQKFEIVYDKVIKNGV